MKKKIDIPIHFIFKENKQYLECKMKQEKFDINDFEKLLKILKSDKTSQCKLSDSEFNSKGNSTSISNPYLSLIESYIYLSQKDSSDSTADSSEILENTSSIIAHDFVEKKFNLARITHCLKNKFYDITLTLEIKNFNHPIKYKISDENYAFLYPNELITFCITVSGFIFKKNMLNRNAICNQYKESQYNQIIGLFFCGKNVKLNESTTKKCSPNEFMCKNCVEINKKTYNLKEHYLVNIFGRVSKKNKGVYHCFGNFLVNNKIEECVTSYVCKACSLLNDFSNYYQK